MYAALNLIKRVGNLQQIRKTTRIVDSDGSMYVWSYNYRYLARGLNRKLQKCIDVAKCLYLPTRIRTAIRNFAKPSSCSHKNTCFQGAAEAMKCALLSCAANRKFTHICNEFHSDCTNHRIIIENQINCSKKLHFCWKL